MSRAKWSILALGILLVSLVVLFSCTKTVSQPVAKEQINVSVKVNLESYSGLKSVSSSVTAFLDDLEKVKLLVKDSSNNVVKSDETTQKSNISFNIQLDQAGTYTFEIQGLDKNGTKIFGGSKQQAVIIGTNNTVIIDATFEPGTIKTTVEFSDEVWDRYNVEFAKLTYKKDTDTQGNGETMNLNINSKSTNTEKQVQPGMWNVKFDIKLNAKDQYTTPAQWQPQTPPQVSIPVDPAKVREIKFKVQFNSQRNEPEVVVVVTQVNLPFIEPVTDLAVTWNKANNTLSISWNYNQAGATFYVYKEIKNIENGQEYYYYELVGSTQEKSYTIENYTTQENDRINGIAINVVLDGKESGLTKLSKAQFTEASQITVGKVTNLSATYDGEKIKLSWTYAQQSNGFRVYKKLTGGDYQLIGQVQTSPAEVSLSSNDYNNLAEVAVSVVYQGIEGEKEILAKANILPFDGGDGTAQSPYLIRTAWQLQRLGDSSYLSSGKYFKLISDIDLQGATWSPIGSYQTPFKGNLDGNGKKISNLTYNNGDTSNIGLFGYIESATVKNLTVENANFTGKSYVGALTGGMKNSTVEKVAVINSYIEAKDSTNSNHAGGLAGDINIGCTVSNSFVRDTTVKGAKDRIGGFAGRIYGTSTNKTTVSNCYVQSTTAEVVGASGALTNAGGFVGYYNIASDSGGVINCYSAIKVTNGGGFAGNVASNGKSGAASNYFDTQVAGTTTDGLGPSLGVSGKTTAEMKQQATFAGWDFTNIWRINEGQDYPRLRWEQ